jgi:hypothetical protein
MQHLKSLWLTGLLQLGDAKKGAGLFKVHNTDKASAYHHSHRRNAVLITA